MTYATERNGGRRVTCRSFCRFVMQQRGENRLGSSSIAPNNRCRAKKNLFRSIVTWCMQRNATVEGGLLAAHSVGLSCSQERKIFLNLQIEHLTTVVELKSIDSDE